MKYTSFLIKYAEIAIKGKNRYMFEDALVRQIKIALNKCEGKYEISKASGRIYVEYLSDYDFDETVGALTKVFGITGVCPVVHVEDKGFEQLASDVTSFIDEVYPDKNKTFKVNSRRARKNYPLESMEINAKLGEVLLNAFPELSVDVHNPEIMLNVEIREKIYIYSEVIKGPGGMPIGTNGKAMLLLSGGIDSPVAGYMKCSSMHRHTPQSELSRRSLIWRKRLLNIRDRFTFTLLILRIFSCTYMTSVHMMS